MDIWALPAWLTGAIFGGVGGIVGFFLGSLLEMLTKKKSIRDVTVTVCTVIAIGILVWQMRERRVEAEMAAPEASVASESEMAVPE